MSLQTHNTFVLFILRTQFNIFIMKTESFLSILTAIIQLKRWRFKNLILNPY